jgi:hypothetical protein
MRDVREEILVLIHEILADMEGAPVVAGAAYRNRPGMPKEIRPCALLLDGEERIVGTMDRRSSGRATTAKPLIMDLEPDIFYAMLTKTVAEHTLTGPEMSGYRMAVLNAIMFNEELAALLGPNGGIHYRGHTTDMKNGMEALGTQQFFFTFRYVLDPEHLT